MEIKNNKKVIITGKKVCLVTGILSGICGVYWLVKALFYDDSNLPVILSRLCFSFFLLRNVNMEKLKSFLKKSSTMLRGILFPATTPLTKSIRRIMCEW